MVGVVAKACSIQHLTCYPRISVHAVQQHPFSVFGTNRCLSRQSGARRESTHQQAAFGKAVRLKVVVRPTGRLQEGETRREHEKSPRLYRDWCWRQRNFALLWRRDAPSG